MWPWTITILGLLVFTFGSCGFTPSARAQVGELRNLAEERLKEVSRFVEKEGIKLNFEGALINASFILVPTEKSPVDRLEDLRAGKVVGAIFSARYPPRLKLESGGYAVRVRQQELKWVAHFLDRDGKIRAEVPSLTRKIPKVERPFVLLIPGFMLPEPVSYMAICWYFDETCVCD